MTMNEVSERYRIPIELLKSYEEWGLCTAAKQVMGVWQYNDQDLERLSMIMTLHDAGFHYGEVEAYMRLLLEGAETKEERISILKAKRISVLDDIHRKEKQLEWLDSLQLKIQKARYW